MLLPDTAPCGYSTTVFALTELRHRCPYRDEDDFGSVAIRWHTRGQTIELHSLRRWLDGFEHERMSHEQVTHAIRSALARLMGIEIVSVETRWSTAECFVSVQGV